MMKEEMKVKSTAKRYEPAIAKVTQKQFKSFV